MKGTWKTISREIFLENVINNKLIRTSKRAQIILPSYIGKKFSIHNGNSFVDIEVTENMLGKKLGEFSPTRKSFSFKKKK